MYLGEKDTGMCHVTSRYAKKTLIMYRVQRRKPFPLVANVYKGTTLLTRVLGTFPLWGFLLGIGGVVKIYKKGIMLWMDY